MDKLRNGKRRQEPALLNLTKEKQKKEKKKEKKNNKKKTSRDGPDWTGYLPFFGAVWTDMARRHNTKQQTSLPLYISSCSNFLEP
jgi:hypothetical protein